MRGFFRNRIKKSYIFFIALITLGIVCTNLVMQTMNVSKVETTEYKAGIEEAPFTNANIVKSALNIAAYGRKNNIRRNSEKLVLQ